MGSKGPNSFTKKTKKMFEQILILSGAVLWIILFAASSMYVRLYFIEKRVKLKQEQRRQKA